MITNRLFYLLFFFSTLFNTSLFGQDTSDPVKPDLANYEARKEYYFNLYNSGNSIMIQKFKGQDINKEDLKTYLDSTYKKDTSEADDFQIAYLIRVLQFKKNNNIENDRIVEKEILDVFKLFPFELTKNEKVKQYWSENHLILWKSSLWLLHEKYGKIDNHWLLNKNKEAQIKNELIHFLKNKIKYGFYEFLSSRYNKFTFAGMLNLADFSNDAEIKNLATIASKKLVGEILKFTTNKGVFFPTSGRAAGNNKYNDNDSDGAIGINLLTGFGKMQTDTSGYIVPFLLTSKVDFKDEINSWKAYEDNITKMDDKLEFSSEERKQLSEDYIIMSKWTARDYLNPKHIKESAQLIEKYNLQNHDAFKSNNEVFSKISNIIINKTKRPILGPVIFKISKIIYNLARPYSTSAALNKREIVLFKNKAIAMSSVQNHFKGYNGYDKFPIVATVGERSIYTISGESTKKDPSKKKFELPKENTHLPYVKQRSNVALVMYNGSPLLFPTKKSQIKRTVNLRWDSINFSKTIDHENWIIGEDSNNKSYIAVRRPCGKNAINNIMTCNKELQAWVYVVGNQEMYGSFDEFLKIIKNSTFKENSDEMIAKKLNPKPFYTAEINILGTTLKHRWSDDEKSNQYIPIPKNNFKNLNNIITSQTDINTKNSLPITNTSSNLKIYPIPASDYITIDTSPFLNSAASLEIYSLQGIKVYDKNFSILKENLYNLSTSNLPSGIYLVVLSSKNKTLKQKIIIK